MAIPTSYVARNDNRSVFDDALKMSGQDNQGNQKLNTRALGSEMMVCLQGAERGH